MKNIVMAAGLFLVACCLVAAYLSYQRQTASPPPPPASPARAAPPTAAAAPATTNLSGNQRLAAAPVTTPPTPTALPALPSVATAPAPAELPGNQQQAAAPLTAPPAPAALPIVAATAPAAADLSGQWTMTLHGNGHWYIIIRRLGANRYRLAGGSALIAGDYELADDRLTKTGPAGSPSPCIWRVTAQGTLELMTTSGIMHAGDPMTRTPPRKP